jgi:hypothetical protein
MQETMVRDALSLLEAVDAPRTTVRSHFQWKNDPVWRERYNRVRPEDRERLLAIGDERRRKFGQVSR